MHWLIDVHAHSFAILWNITEIPATFSKSLKDQNVKEKGTLIIECKLTKPNVTVCWQKDGHNLIPDSKVQISSSNSSHYLKMTDVTMDDGGTYTCVCGKEKTECKITVEGNHLS